MLNPIQTISEEKMSADDSTASATSALACPRIPATSLTSTSTALTKSPACAHRMLRLVALLTAWPCLRVGPLQAVGRCIDARRVGLGIFARNAAWNDEFRTFRLVREGSVDEKISAAGDHRCLEAIDGGHQVVELAARLAPGKEHAFLAQPSGKLQHRAVTLLAAMRVQIFLLLLERFLSHPASTFFRVD